MRAPSVASLSAIALVSTGCEAILGIDFGAVHENEVCGSAQPNPPPEVVDAGGANEITVVTTDSRFGDGPNPAGEGGYLTVGYDLDGTCTGRGGEDLCRPPAWVGADVRDGPDGEDNGVGRMFVSQEEIFDLNLVTSDSLNEEVVTGNHAPTGIIRVRGYNGFHADDTLEVDWFVPLAPSALGDDAFVPSFDGGDVWPLSSDDLDDPGPSGEPMSLYRDTSAYVSGYQLVAHFSRVRIPIANIYFDVERVVVTGDIVSRAREGTTLEKGLFTGIVSTSTLLEVLPLTTEAITGASLCGDDPLYASIKKFVCTSADSALGGASDDCDGASAGITFQTAGITLGAEMPIDVPPSSCPPETSPRGDTCQVAPE